MATIEKEPETHSELADSTQYLTFVLDGDSFATEIDQVREVLEFTRITKVPRTPDFMPGVINLRGSVVPVVDMRLQFEMGKTEPTIDTCIVIVEVNIDGQVTVLGALADSVQEVIELRRDQLEPAPRLGTRINTDFIRAMGKHEDKFVIILDMTHVFSANQLAEIQEGGEMAFDQLDTDVEAIEKRDEKLADSESVKAP